MLLHRRCGGKKNKKKIKKTVNLISTGCNLNYLAMKPKGLLSLERFNVLLAKYLLEDNLVFFFDTNLRRGKRCVVGK